MKAGWQMKTLGEICSFENGDRGENYPSKSVQTTSGVPFINAGHLSKSGIDFQTMNYIPRERFNLLGNGKIRNGDILFCLRGSLGKFANVGELSEGAIASSLVIVRPSALVLERFIVAYFDSEICADMINKFRNGAAQPNLSAGNLKKFLIPLPALPEQQCIVAILDEAFEGIATATANAKKNLINARELFESTLQSVFATKSEGWQTKNLGEVCLIKPPKNEARKNLKSSDLVSFVPMESLGIGQKYFDVSRLRALEEVAGSYTYFADGDVLLAKITPCFENGKLGIARNLKNGVGFGSSEYIVFRSSTALHNEFLYYFLSREAFREEGAKRMTGAVGHKRVAKEFIENTFIPLPSFPEQQRITDKLDELSAETKKLEAIYQQKLTALNELKKSILNQVFAGELC